MAQTDTLEMAKQLSYDKKFEAAEMLLQAYELNHKNEVNTIRFHAQVLNWQNKYRSAFKLYDAYLTNNNPEENLLLDYGRMLFERAYYNSAKEILKSLILMQPRQVEALNMLSNIAFWQGKAKQTNHYLDTIFRYYPANEWATSIKQQQATQRAPYLNLKFLYQDDSQPMQSYRSQLQFGFYHSSVFAPFLKANWNNADSSGKSAISYDVSIGNKFYFAASKTSLQLEGGLVQPMADTSLNWIGALNLQQRLAKNLHLDLSFARKNYEQTLSNFSNAILHNDYQVGINFHNKKNWSAQVAGLLQQFDDSNLCYHAYVWLLAPLVNKDNFQLQLGYAYSYSNSLENRFGLYKNAEQTIAVFDSTNVIPALYTPYFTPQNQYIHAALLQVNWQMSKQWNLQLSGNYGFYAYAQSPYVYFDFNERKQVILVRDYYWQNYHPLEGKIHIGYACSSKFSLHLDYSYKEAFFYTGHTGTLGLNFTF